LLVLNVDQTGDTRTRRRISLPSIEFSFPKITEDPGSRSPGSKPCQFFEQEEGQKTALQGSSKANGASVATHQPDRGEEGSSKKKVRWRVQWDAATGEESSSIIPDIPIGEARPRNMLLPRTSLGRDKQPTSTLPGSKHAYVCIARILAVPLPRFSHQDSPFREESACIFWG